MSTIINMTDFNLLIKEKYGLSGRVNTYINAKDENKLVKLPSLETYVPTKDHFFQQFFQQAFLPQGYPRTVSKDYFNYQLYDTIQAFASRITGTISTKAILKGVGVGNAAATPLAAAVTWIFKDGAGMLGGILFAWWKGTEFDSNCKKWRLFADILNDSAMFCELFIPYFPDFSLPLLCTTTCMKAGVGVAGAATRVAITQHQAIAGNTADVAAKDGSQETAVNLVASVFGLIVLANFADDSWLEWFIFVVFVLVHLYANYCAVSALMFNGLNVARLNIVLEGYFRSGVVASPEDVNKNESVILGCGRNAQNLFGFNIKLGQSLQTVASKLTTNDMKQLAIMDNYFIVPDVKNRNMNIILRSGETPIVIFVAYFHAVILSLAVTDKLSHDNFYKRMLINSKLITKLKNLMTTSDTKIITEFIDKELDTFIQELKNKGWNTSLHSIRVDDWRLEEF